MKVGIITFHFVSNQGGVLQSYALQEFLKKNGHTPAIIDYRPAYHTVRYAAKKNPFLYARGFWKKNAAKKISKRMYLTGRSFLRGIYMNVKHTDRRTEESFDKFIRDNLNLTGRYLTFSQLQKNPPQLDAFISGSDQLWNPELLDQKFDEAYFVKFGAPDCPRITYAVSMGRNLEKKYTDQLRALCKGLTAVSLREYNAEAVEAIGQDVHICIDPTLLLNAEDYASVESKTQETEPYIFVYGFETNEQIQTAVELARKKYRCRVINGSPSRVKLQDSCINANVYGPDQFLSYIKNAQCIVTNSFHGTAFSTIYRKDFITVAHSTRGKRMNDLLCRLGLTNRLFASPDFNFSTEIDYGGVYEKLSVLRKGSAEYLLRALEGMKGEDIPHYTGEMQEWDISR